MGAGLLEWPACHRWARMWSGSSPSEYARSVLAEVVRRAVGTGIDQVDRIVEGYSNEVYRVRCADGQDVVVRILRFDDDELPPARRARPGRSSRPVPPACPPRRSCCSTRYGSTAPEFPVMVQRTVPGRPLGEVINRLSRAATARCARRDRRTGRPTQRDPVDDERDWPTAMAADLADRHAERDKILAGGFSAPQFDRMLDLLEGYVRDFPCEQWVLCHGDLSPKHIFVTGDGRDGAAVQVSGIIDFGDWQPGAPVHDLAVLRVRGPRLDLPPLLAGYGAPTDGTFRRQLDLHTLIIALCFARFGVDEDDQACIERSGHLIRTLVADLDNPDF